MSPPELPNGRDNKELVPEVEKALRDEQLPPEFRKLPEEVRHQVVQKLSSVAVRISSHESWEGSYPPPQALQKFEEVLPGSADRIFKMAENDLDNRHLHDREVSRYMHRGQIFGFILAGIALLGSIFLIAIDKTITGTILGATVLVPLVALFVTGQVQANSAHRPKADPPQAPAGSPANGKSPLKATNGKRPGGRRN